ncbi:MAG: hypothetical protein JNG90_19210, partial [Planctomycetaceae bacterium]|nr:hypothetical protein [Planctomycetaceae bacterium]
VQARLAASIAAELERLGAALPAAEPVGLSPQPVGVVRAEVVDDPLLHGSIELQPPGTSAAAMTEASIRAETSPPPETIPLAPPHLPPLSPAGAAQQEAQQRVRRYRESLTGGEPVAAAPSAAPPPKTRLADLLATFMEEKNVRWGELVGGMLIVGCSIALVISFWAQIAAQPVLKFGLFNGIVTALFGLGFYTERKWKLPTTSRAILMIATLLVPLNFLTIAAFTRGDVSNHPGVIIGEAVSILLFSGLVYLGGRTIAPQAPLALTIGVLGASIAQLTIRRWIQPGATESVLYALAAWPLGCHAVAVGANCFRLRRGAAPTEAQIHALLRVVGLTAFAALTASGLLLSLSEQPAATLGRLAPLVSLAGAPSLAAGLLLWRRLQPSELTGLRTAGTAIAILGSAIMLGGIALAWPDPARLVAVAALNFVVLTLVALAYELPAAHLLAGAGLAVGSLITLHAVRGEIAWTHGSTTATLRALASAVSGNALAALGVLYAAGGAGWLWLRRVGDARGYFATAGLLGAASLALVTAFGFRTVGDPYGTTWVYALSGAGALAAAFAWERAGSQLSSRSERMVRLLAWCAAALAALALIQGLVYRPLPPEGFQTPWTTAALVHALLLLGLALLAGLAKEKCLRTRDVLEQAAQLTAGVGALLIVRDALGWITPRVDHLTSLIHTLMLAAAWFGLALRRGSQALFSWGQAALLAAVSCGAMLIAERQPWWSESTRQAFDPRLWQILGIGWGVYALAWTVLRTALDRWAGPAVSIEAAEPAAARPLAWRLLHPEWPAVDAWATAATLAVLVAISTYGVLPGVAQELSLESSVARLAQDAPDLVTQVAPDRIVPATEAFELPGVPHAPASAGASWLLLGILATTLVAGCWERAGGMRVLGLLVVGAVACPLLAARFEPEVAAASALRWMAVGYFASGSIALWSRAQLVQLGTRVGWRCAATADDRLAASPLATLISLALLPLLGMAGFVAWGSLSTTAATGETTEILLGTGVLFVGAAVVAAFLATVARSSQEGSEATNAGWTAWAGPASAIVLLLGVAPLVIVSVYVIAAQLAGDPVIGPDASSLFVSMGPAANYAIPAALVAMVLVGYALRERSESFAFAAGLVTNLTATIAYLFTAGSQLTLREPRLWTDLGLLNALVAALFGIAWFGLVWAATRGAERRSLGQLLVAQAALALAPLLGVLGATAGGLLLDPHPPAAWLHNAASPMGIAAALATFGLALALSSGRSRVATTAVAATGLWSGCALAASAAVPWDIGDWLALHVLLAAHMLAPWLLLAGGAWWYRHAALAHHDAARRALTFWTALLAVPLVIISLRLVGASDPQEPWWSTGGVKLAAGVATLLAIWSCQRRFLYLASALVVLAMIIWFPRSALYPQGAPTNGEVTAFVYAALFALALPAGLWLVVELRWIRPALERLGRWWGLPVHRPATWFAVGALAYVTALGVAADFRGSPLETSTGYGIAATAAIALAVLACLWDARARESVAMLYLFGLVLVGSFLDALNLAGDRLLWTGTIALGAFTLATSYLWSRRRGLQSLAAQLRLPIPADPESSGALWIRAFTTILVALVVGLAFWVEVTCPDRELRISAGFAAIFQAFALALLAQGTLRASLQRDALVAGILGAIAFSWAFVPPDAPLPILSRSVATSVALVVVSIVYGLGLARLPLRLTDWVPAAERIAPLAVGGLLLSVAGVLGQEVSYYLRDGAVPLELPAVAAVVATLL